MLTLTSADFLFKLGGIPWFGSLSAPFPYLSGWRLFPLTIETLGFMPFKEFLHFSYIVSIFQFLIN